MKKLRSTIITVLLLALLLLQPVAAGAASASDAKQAWYEAKQESFEAQEAYRNARTRWAGDKNPENNQEVIDTGKEALNAALDESEAWLLWKDLEAEENPEIPEELKQSIHEDVAVNLEKIEELRGEVEGVQTRVQLGATYLKMVGKYFELMSDVARNTGSMWVHVANTRVDTIEEYEATLREAAEGMENNEDIIAKLDMVKSDLRNARANIDSAEAEYAQVRLPGTPLIKFSNGNNYLRIARNNMLSAHRYLNEAYTLMVSKAA